jgi:acyl-CoA thioesterase
MTLSPKSRAEQSAAAMWEGDKASQALGMKIETVDAGQAVLSLQVLPQHLNGHGICHGGITFALADSCFAFACNSRNQSTVAQHNMISYLAPATLGDILTATAQEISLAGRNGIYDVTVSNQNGTKIAEFRGYSRAIKGQLFQE